MAYAHEETAAEQAMRHELRRRGLRFHQGEIIAGREVDFFLPDCLLAIEVDGLSHLVTSVGERDRVKELLLAGLGIAVMRFSNREVLVETRACGDRVADYARTWENRVKRAAAPAGETPLQRGLRAWLRRDGHRTADRGGQPSRRGRGQEAGGRQGPSALQVKTKGSRSLG